VINNRDTDGGRCPSPLVAMPVVCGMVLPARLTYNGCLYRVVRSHTCGSGYDEE
jgi:hypothetical protein